MAVIPVHQRARPVDQPEQKEPAWIDKQLGRVLTGLQIAQAGYGIYSNHEALKLKEEELKVQGAKNIQEIEADLADKWRTDKRAEQIVQEYQNANKVEEFLKDPNNVSSPKFGASLMSLVRSTAGGGQLSDKDLELFAPDPSLIGRIKSVWSKALYGKAAPSDVLALRDVAEIMRKKAIKDMESHAGWFADSQGRRVGNKDYVVNNILLPRSRLTGAAAPAQLTWRKDGRGLEGQTQAGETRVREKNIQIPTAQSRQIEEIELLYNQGKLDKRITEEHIQQQMQKGGLTKGQAIWNLNRALRKLDEKKVRQKVQQNFNKREGARQEARETLKALPQGQK